VPGIDSSPRKRLLLALLALASGTGLVALVGWSLFRALEEGRARAELDAREEARRNAEWLRARLRDRTLDGVPSGCRFTVRAGSVVVPDDVGSTHPKHRRTSSSGPATPTADIAAAARAAIAQIHQTAGTGK
jgi:hypothetical protein